MRIDMLHLLLVVCLYVTCSSSSQRVGLGQTPQTRGALHVRGGERRDSSGFEQRNDSAAADGADVRGNRNASANSVTEEKILSSVIEESGGSGMLRTVDPMMIDDDIFADDGFVTVEATHAQEESTLGNPPEPPPPSDGSVGQAAKSQSLSDGGRGAYVPNVMEDEDEEAASLLVAPSVSSSSTKSSVQSSSPRAEDIARNLDERTEEEDEVLLTMEERGQTDFLREALQSAIDQQLQSPPFVPSISQALRSRLGPFRFKGFGSSMIKPLNKVHSVGIGLRIPVSANFPQYDANVGLPRLSSMLSLFSTYDESYIRWSVSTSLPTRVAAYYLAFLAFKARLMPLSVSESIRLRRATDSVKRVGCTFSIRYGTANGFKWAVGPWVYYLPGKKVMTRLLPLILSSPALLIAFMNLFVDMREVLGAFLGLESDSFSSYGDSPGTGGVGAGAGSAMTQPVVDIDDDLVPRAPALGPLQMSHVALWRSRLLTWAATKTTGLGFNVGYGKTQGQASDFRASMAFDVQPFFPSADSLSLTAYRLLRLAQELWRGDGTGETEVEADEGELGVTGTGMAQAQAQGLVSGSAGRKGDQGAIDRLYANRGATKRGAAASQGQGQGGGGGKIKRAGTRMRQIKRPGKESRPVRSKDRDRDRGEVGTRA